MFMHKNKKGFTIVELVVVIAVVAILAAVLIPSFSSLNKKAKDSAYLQERTNQQIADLAEKVDNQDFLSWEDLEAKLAEELAKIETGAGEQEVKDAISTALAKFETSLKDNNTALTQDQVKAIVEKALEGQLTTAQVEAIVKAAVDNIQLPTGETVTTAQIKDIVDTAVAGLNKETGITKEEMAAAIEAALKAQDNLSAADVTAAVNGALAGFGYGNDISASQVKDIINAAMGTAKVTADQLAIADMNAAVTGKSFAYAGDVVSALYAAGFNAGKLQPYAAGSHYAYDSANKTFCILDENGSTDTNLWGFFNNNTHDKITGVTSYIALTTVTNKIAFDEVFANGGTLDLNKTFIGIAGKSDVTVQNGQMRTDAAFTEGGSVTKKAVATTNYVTKDNGVYTIEEVVMTASTAGVISNVLNMGDDYADATALVFKNVTFDFETSDAVVRIIAEETKAQSIVFDGCTILMGTQVFNIGGSEEYKPDITIKNCYISSSRGFNFAINGGSGVSDETTYGNIVIENNVFVDNGVQGGKAAIQFGGRKSDGAFTAESITIKNNEFNGDYVAIRIHEDTKIMNCDNVTISGNKFSGCTKIDGDGQTWSETIAAEWATKIQ